MKKVIIFDVDGTLLKCASEKLLVLELFKRKKINLFSLFLYFLPKLFGKLNLQYAEKYFYVNYSRNYLKRLKKNEIDSIIDNLWNEKLSDKINKNLFEKLNNYKEENNTTIMLLSSSLDILLKPLKDYTKADYLLCSKVEIENNIFTGKLLNKSPIGEEKVNAIKKFIKQNNWNGDDIYLICYADDMKKDKFILDYSDEKYLVT